jgi:hypothetical protein
MSLTSFLKNSADVRERFKSEFVTPPLGTMKDLIAPPLTPSPSPVGTAFDYLLRFYIERLNPKSKVREWIAEVAADDFPELLEKARESHKQFLQNGNISDELLQAVLCLAQLEPLGRRFVDDSYLDTIGKIDPKDVQDLRKLISLVRPEMFKAQNVCLLNPCFGRASELVGGADCDLVIDDSLIDIKTVKDFKVKREYFDQLIGYYVLSRIGGIEGSPKAHSINRLGIYFSRHGYLWLFNVGEVLKEAQLPSFLDWFKKRAKQEF